jgi:hypothetical protein
MHKSNFKYLWDELAGLLGLFRTRVDVVES